MDISAKIERLLPPKITLTPEYDGALTASILSERALKLWSHPAFPTDLPGNTLRSPLVRDPACSRPGKGKDRDRQAVG
jgi:hypothetical protein